MMMVVVVMMRVIKGYLLRLRLELEAWLIVTWQGRPAEWACSSWEVDTDLHSREDSRLPGHHGVTVGAGKPREEFFCKRNQVPLARLQGLRILGKERLKLTGPSVA